MDQVLRYKSYQGSIECDVDSGELYGKILFINDLVTFGGSTVPELNTSFQEAVDDYLETCVEIGKEPDQPFNGSFNVRLGCELHKKAAYDASKQGIKLNEWVKQACEAKLVGTGEYIRQRGIF